MIFKNLLRKKSKKAMLESITWFKQYNEDEYLFEELIIDKKGEEVCLITTFDKDSKFGKISIFDYNKSNDSVYFHINNKELVIADIRIFKSKNRGIGTKILEVLDKVALMNKCNKITGGLSNVDADHRDRQIHFYKKNGFTINYDVLSDFGGPTIIKNI